MYKDELISIHELLCYICKFLGDSGAPKSYFDKYRELYISPHHIHKKKQEHQYAIFILTECISNVLTEHGGVPRSFVTKTKRLSKRTAEEMFL